MTILDFILVAPMLYLCYKGIRKGLVKRIMAIIGLILAAIVSYVYNEEVADLISDYWQHSSVIYISFIAPFILVVTFVKLVASAVTQGLKIIALSPINIFLGAVFGALQGALLSIIIALVLIMVNNTIDTPLQELAQESLLISHTRPYLFNILDYLAC